MGIQYGERGLNEYYMFMKCKFVFNIQRFRAKGERMPGLIGKKKEEKEEENTTQWMFENITREITAF
jgi:hypothetical protein